MPRSGSQQPGLTRQAGDDVGPGALVDSIRLHHAFFRLGLVPTSGNTLALAVDKPGEAPFWAVLLNL